MNIFTYKEYMNLVEQNASVESTEISVDRQALNKLNFSRMRRWNKKDLISPSIKKEILKIQRPQVWTVISETWCGDSAHALPVLNQIADLNQNIQLNIVLRDENPAFMDEYLYNGTKSIPRVISKDLDHQDLFVWGPRPKHPTSIIEKAKEGFYEMADAKIIIQKWYNQDKGQQIIREFLRAMVKADHLVMEDA